MSLETVEAKVDNILKVMNGNGKIGIIAKVQMLWEGKKTSMGLVDWAFRITIASVLGYIAVKVGLR